VDTIKGIAQNAHLKKGRTCQNLSYQRNSTHKRKKGTTNVKQTGLSNIQQIQHYKKDENILKFLNPAKY